MSVVSNSLKLDTQTHTHIHLAHESDRLPSTWLKTSCIIINYGCFDQVYMYVSTKPLSYIVQLIQSSNLTYIS